MNRSTHHFLHQPLLSINLFYPSTSPINQLLLSINLSYQSTQSVQTFNLSVFLHPSTPPSSAVIHHLPICLYIFQFIYSSFDPNNRSVRTPLFSSSKVSFTSLFSYNHYKPYYKFSHIPPTQSLQRNTPSNTRSFIVCILSNSSPTDFIL